MMRLIAAVIMLVICVVFSPCGAEAAYVLNTPRPPNGPHNAEPVLPALQGFWASPDCSNPGRILLVTPHYALLSRGGAFRIGAILAWRQEPQPDTSMLYSLNTNAQFAMLIHKTEEPSMRVLFSAVHPKTALSAAWSPGDEKTAFRFTRCDQVSGPAASRTQEELKTLPMIEQIGAACNALAGADAFASATSCHQAMFAAADRNGDRVLDHAELARLYRQASFGMVGTFMCRKDGYPGNSVAEAEEFATVVLGNNKTIGFDASVALLRDPANGQGRIYSFIENVRRMETVFAFLPPPDAGKICPFSNPEIMRNGGTVPLPPEKAATP